MWVLEMLQNWAVEAVSTDQTKKEKKVSEKVNEKVLKKAKKQIEKGVEKFSDKKSDSYARDVEHNINAWCSIWEDSKKAKAYREWWNGIYKHMAELEKEKEEK